MIRNKEIEMIIVGSVPTAQAYLGIELYKGKVIKNVRFITSLWPEAEQIIYRKGISNQIFNLIFRKSKLCEWDLETSRKEIVILL